MSRRALVTQTRLPEVDRDRGSQRVDQLMHALLGAGWSVTFIAGETDSDARQAHRLRQLGIATFEGYDAADEVIVHGDFDLALLAFWEPASRLIPILRSRSPRTRVIVDSIDLHFVRDARRLFGVRGRLDERYGNQLVGELNTYWAADAVLAVSTREADVLRDLLGSERVYELGLADPSTRSPRPFAERRGMLFVGNFRHLPNSEAVAYLCRDILPRLSPALLDEHPLAVVGSHLDDKVGEHARGLRGIRMVGWVPSVVPYLSHARVCAVPLLHGAGVKGKVIESMMAGTPVVTTKIGAEGLHLEHDRHALIASTPDEFANGLHRLLTDEPTWQRLADEGYEHVRMAHAPEGIAQQLLAIVDDVLSRPSDAADTFRYGRQREYAYQQTVGAVHRALQRVTKPGSTVVVISRGDDELVDIAGRQGEHFPQSASGEWAGYHPEDSDAAISHLEAVRARGAHYLVLPNTAFWWLHYYREFGSHLDDRYRRVHSDEHAVVFALDDLVPIAPASDIGGARPRVVVRGTFDASRAGPPASVTAELARATSFEVSQHWVSADRSGVAALAPLPDQVDVRDWVLYLDDTVVLPSGFVDELFSVAAQLTAFGVERVQPAGANGPGTDSPVTERVLGVVAREVGAVTPVPVLAVRAGAAIEGPVAIVDAVTISVVRPHRAAADPVTYSGVSDVFVRRDDGIFRGVRRGQLSPRPVISVLIATYDRPELLGACLDAFTEQSLPRSDLEVVVVDDGSPGDATNEILERAARSLPLTWVRIDHAGRSAAKNLALLLARADVVLFFDDDDRPATDMLEEHVRGHAEHPELGAAVLGYTAWAPELTVTPLMHYLTDIDKLLFAYGNLDDGQHLDWRGFWEGRISSKRAFHLRHGLHDQRLAYSIDVELGWRLARHGLDVVYRRSARSYMARPVDLDTFCERIEAKGRAHALIAALHPDDAELRAYANIDGAHARWAAAAPQIDELRARVRELEALDGDHLLELHGAYRALFRALDAKGVVEASVAGRPPPPARPVAPATVAASDGAPELTVTIPVWSHTAELADMAARTIERVWEVARLRTQVVVVDNGSPVSRKLRAHVYHFPENRGVAVGWNTGIALAEAPVVAVLNSDCLVERCWDEAMYEAATSARRIAFPYTDHCDGEGFRRPDQAGTAGWCFMATVALFAEIGEFDESFSPAFGEDTDYWHRAWELGVELTPVPAARVRHARRTTSGTDVRSEWLLLAHRYKYGWKHGVDPLRAPPFYNREIVDYHVRGSHTAVTT